VVLALVQLVDRLAAFEVAAAQDAGLLELRQHPVHRGQADVGAVTSSTRKHVFGRHVRGAPFWKTSRIFMRGSVAFRPVLLSSSMLDRDTAAPELKLLCFGNEDHGFLHRGLPLCSSSRCE
jgi:hypothetical protein